MHLEHDFAWVAHRDSAAWLARAWTAMLALGLLGGSDATRDATRGATRGGLGRPDGAHAQRAAMAGLDWAALMRNCRAKPCWALDASNFWKCAPRLREWPAGTEALRGPTPPEHLAHPRAATWPSEKASDWAMDRACRHIRDASHFNGEPELALGLALYARPATLRAAGATHALEHSSRAGAGGGLELPAASGMRLGFPPPKLRRGHVALQSGLMGVEWSTSTVLEAALLLPEILILALVCFRVWRQC